MAKKETSYKDAITEIEEIIQKIENEELEIDELSEKVKRASVLIKICQKKIHQTENEIQKIIDDIEIN